MAILIGVLIILLGIIALYSSLLKMNQKDYKEKGVIRVRSNIEFGLGIFLVAFGTFILI
ncbi:hypothetical protein [Bacillus marasmi]|uniref:hypothetical protein n=1 Tax=Bacillus marasmi TaxID=1926279 RepID=UPI00164EC000|nr:hypothetical protein [Bacillus marasmi]